MLFIRANERCKGHFRQLECVMADVAQFYDELAPYYDQMFENWEVSIRRQAEVLSSLLYEECGGKRPMRVLDCACGIGTQSLGLAMKGFDVTGCDVSCRAVERACSEAAKRGLNIPFSVADMGQLAAIPDSMFDALICMDNSLPHLETDEQLFEAARQAYRKLRPGGAFIGSIRDYDQLVVEQPKILGPSFYSDSGTRRIVFQIWDWEDERRYRFHLYITRSTESAWHTCHFTSTYRAVLRSELGQIWEQAGFTNLQWQLPSESGFYQPIFIARRNS